MYRNREMNRDTALNIAADIGLKVSDRDASGRAIPVTARVTIQPEGEGFDIVIPAELAVKLYLTGMRDGVKHR